MQNISLWSSGMHRKQNFEIVFGLKSDTTVLTFTFHFLSSLFIHFSCLIFFGWDLVGFILLGKVFGKAFRILGLEERKVHCKVGSGTRFLLTFSGQCYMVFCLFLGCPAHSGMETCSFWYGMKDLFTLHKLLVADKVVFEVEGTWIRTGSYGWFRGKWVNGQRGIERW